MLQYWRCTQQKSYDEVASCVEENAVKIDWLPQFLDYNGADFCTDPDNILTRQVGLILIHLASTVLCATVGAAAWKKLKRLFGFGKDKKASRGDENPGTDMQPGLWKEPFNITGQPVPAGQRQANPTGEPQSAPRGVWEWETRWVLKPSNVLRSIGKEILASYLTIIVLEKAGLAGTYSTQLDFLQLLFFYIIRPRIAPFTGLLGFCQGFSQTGLADLFADGVLSFVAGTSILVPFWFLFLPQPNPAAPTQALKIVATGALLSAAPAYFFFFAILLLSLFLGLMGANLLISIVLFLIVPLLIAVFLVLLPILGVIELVAMGVVGIMPLFKKLSNDRPKTCWEPLAVSGRKFRFIYAVMLLSSIVINVGNWLFFANYLKLEGEMFCPADIGEVTAIWLLVPAAVDLVYYTYRGLTQPQGV